MKIRFFIVLIFFLTSAQAGVDIISTVERVQINGDGKLWIKMTNSRFDQYCKPGWYGFNMYIPESDKSYPYYYELVISALSKDQSLYISNIGIYDGTQSCDLTKTGYGIVLQNQ